MLVLASQSPRRREILTAAGIPHLVRTTGVPEERGPGESPLDYVLRLSRAKAEAVHMNEGDVVLGADTVVVLDTQVLEKPRDREDAIRMLRLLSGHSHVVITGICLRTPQIVVADSEQTVVRFVPLTQREVEAYADSGEPMDKAGGYAIQGLASKFVDRIEGCYFNVVGLPIARVYRHLSALSIPPAA
ncbi:MAG TPA: Maf family protein [Bryobacteraceae bacterium]|nr:Maf family protein [Bryobacteraceae bacterium]